MKQVISSHEKSIKSALLHKDDNHLCQNKSALSQDDPSDSLNELACQYVTTRNVKILEKNKNRKFGEDLVVKNIITSDQLQIALHEQRRFKNDVKSSFLEKNTSDLLGHILVSLNFITEEKLSHFLAERTGIPYINLLNQEPLTSCPNLFPETSAKKYLIVPLSYNGRELTIALSDPYDVLAIDEIRRHFSQEIILRPYIASRSDIISFIDRTYGNGIDTKIILNELESVDATTNPFATSGFHENEHPVIKLVENIILDAINIGASDIHLEPENTFVRIRLRVDGLLRQTLALHNTHWSALSHRVKIMSGMNIADTRSIQDGRFQMHVNGDQIDCRVAIMPTCQGENIAIRLLDQKRMLLSLDALGFNGDTLRAVHEIAQKPQGLVLVTGPTGSGKTTTLYAFLRHISSPSIHVATLEDPVEYKIDLIRQTNVNLAQGIDFASGVRGILRMDPDVILIGEIRDPDTAQMALRAAMTGHQVFTTLHCNDSLGAASRLFDLGLQPRVLSGNISGILAQRLARTLCPHCKKPRFATENEETHLRHTHAQNKKITIFESSGCEYCNHSGVIGRTVIAEALSLSQNLDDLLSSDFSRTAVLKQAKDEGFISMQQNGIEKVLNGNISLAELQRILDLSRG